MLTAARASMVLGMTWREIDLAERMWVVRGARMKNDENGDHETQIHLDPKPNIWPSAGSNPDIGRFTAPSKRYQGIGWSLFCLGARSRQCYSQLVRCRYQVVKCSDRRVGASQKDWLLFVCLYLLIQLYNEILRINQPLFYVPLIIECQRDTLLKYCI